MYERNRDRSSDPSWQVAPAPKAKIRLDAFLRRCVPGVSLREIRRWIEAGKVRIDQRMGKKGDILAGGEIVTFCGPPDWLASGPVPRSDLDVVTIYEDEAILVLDKPAGMATHGFSGREANSVANYLAATRPLLRHVGKNVWEPGLVHRLDRETSGLVLVAKEQEVFEALRLQLQQRQVQKKYWALVFGRTEGQGVIDYPLSHDPADRRKMKAVLKDGAPSKRKRKKWEALTRFDRTLYGEGFSLLEVDMKTGVTHQIRAHLASIGHPLVGDALYGSEPAPTGFPQRHFLHAYYLGFCHPRTLKPVVFESPLPQELQEALNRLGMKALKPCR
jgi:23S rRNA pseudouridine1911/1915/1917 synthase